MGSAASPFEGPVRAVLAVFGVVVGLALTRFLTSSQMIKGHIHVLKNSINARKFIRIRASLFYWSSLMILSSIILRFYIGSTAHLHDTYQVNAALTLKDMVLFLKDLFALIVFGILLVKMALSLNPREFLHWLIWFFRLCILWCLAEIFTRGGFLAKWWLLLNLFQLLFAYAGWILLRRRTRQPRWVLGVLGTLAVLYTLSFIADMRTIVKRPPPAILTVSDGI
jgi:hypothetical protein